MPDKPLTIATYAAGASLAAITLVYVFGPTFFIDGEESTSSSSTRKKGIVGLLNPANDCFINSVLQALAGLGDLRVYLIRELHRRTHDVPGLEAHIAAQQYRRAVDRIRGEGLQRGYVTQALKDVLDALNERPIYRKTISARPFLDAVEHAFQTRISRQQQDAQEFLQVITERLCDEYHARKKVQKALRDADLAQALSGALENKKGEPGGSEAIHIENSGEAGSVVNIDVVEQDPLEEEEGFPLEGRLESYIECLTCGFKPKPTVSSFVTLTLNVPVESHTTLNKCFDMLFKTEHIDDFRCDKCRLLHALEVKTAIVQRNTDTPDTEELLEDIEKIKEALEVDPERSLDDAHLPTNSPKRRIARHTRIVSFPKILAIHLSRSIYDARSLSTKNAAKVEFPEVMPVGGILDRKQYNLLGVVTHKGSHNSGHYETFRRQNLIPAFSTPHTLKSPSTTTSAATSGYATPNLNHSIRAASSMSIATPRSDPTLSPRLADSPSFSPSYSSSSLSISSPKLGPSSRPSSSALGEIPRSSPTKDSSPMKDSSPTVPPTRDSDSGSTKSSRSSLKVTFSRLSLPKSPSRSSLRKEKSPTPSSTARTLRGGVGGRNGKHRSSLSNRWWRISDEKIKESRTNDVLGMQKEVYLLFYEIDRTERGLVV